MKIYGGIVIPSLIGRFTFPPIPIDSIVERRQSDNDRLPPLTITIISLLNG
jgi:hypothetical protein